MDPLKLIRPTSPKSLIKLERQKQFFQEEVETFAKFGGNKGIELQQTKERNENQANSRTIIQEWFHLFLKIVNNAPMLEQLKMNLEGVVQKNTELGESIDASYKYVQRVKRNKIRTRKEFQVNT